MCPVEKVMACQISFIPIASDMYTKEVKKVINLIERSNLQLHVEDFSTTVKGDGQKIWDLIRKIYEEMDPLCKFILEIKISNACGCS